MTTLQVTIMPTWSKPISLSKTWTLSVCLRFPYKSKAPGGGDFGHFGRNSGELPKEDPDEEEEEWLRPSITTYSRCSLKPGHSSTRPCNVGPWKMMIVKRCYSWKTWRDRQCTWEQDRDRLRLGRLKPWVPELVPVSLQEWGRERRTALELEEPPHVTVTQDTL